MDNGDAALQPAQYVAGAYKFRTDTTLSGKERNREKMKFQEKIVSYGRWTHLA